jgi:hypothetical protein
MHLVRLITEGEELLSTGKITLPRPDAKFLLQVKNGFFSYDEIMQYAEDGDNRLQKIHDESDLPFSADVETIEKVLIALYSIQILYEM